MKLLVIIARDDYAQGISDILVNHGYRATNIGSSGEFLQYGNTVLLLGIEDNEVQKVVQLVESLKEHDRVQIHVIPAYDFVKVKQYTK